MSRKLCPVYDYLCEAYDGKTCCLIGGVDEPCHHEHNQLIKHIRKEILRGMHIAKKININNISIG